MNLALFGPPGAGKGTQGERLVARFDLTHLSTGDLLRREIKEGTTLGREVEAILARGELVGDEIVERMVREEVRRSQEAGRGVLFDGYPRNVAQLRTLDAMLDGLGTALHLCVDLRIDEEILVERLTARRVCRDCKRPYNLITRTPARAGRCDECGGELEQREDDREDVIRRRLAAHHEQTRPLIEELNRQGRLRSVEGDGKIEAIGERLERIVRDWPDGAGAG